MGQEEYQYLSRFLNRFARRFKLLRALEGVCVTAICALVLLALGPGIAQLKNFFPYAPLAYSILTASVLLAAIGWTLFHFLRRFSQETAALYIEQQQPRLRNNLINSLQLYPQVVEQRGTAGASASMILALLRVTRKQVADLQIADLLDTRRVKAGMRLLGFVALPVLAMVLLNPSWVSGTFGMLTDPLAHLPPTTTSIEMEPKGVRLVRGAPLTIAAVTAGALPQSLQLITWTGANPTGELLGVENLAMENLGAGKFSAKMARLDKTLHYRAVTGPFSSNTYTAEAVDPPEIANVQIILYPPAYSGLGSIAVPEGNIEGLKGSTVRDEPSSP